MSKHEWVLIAAVLVCLSFFVKIDDSRFAVPAWPSFPNWPSWPNGPAPVIPAPPPPSPGPQPEPVPRVSREEALQKATAQDLQQYVEYFASPELAGRGSGTEGNKKAANYIAERLAELKIPVKRQQFTVRGKETENIIGYLQPKDPKSEQVIVVGAHFDHLGGSSESYYPGADDNASGTAAVLEIAEVLAASRHALRHTVLLQFYSGEEQGLLGSAHYCSNPLFPETGPDINKHAAMINLDMVGYLRESGAVTPAEMWRLREGENEIMPDDFTRLGPPVDMKDFVTRLGEKYAFGPRISGYKPGGSDHAPFYRKSVPVVFLHTGTHPHYHKKTDTPEKLNYRGAEAIARFAAELVWSVDDFLATR